MHEDRNLNNQSYRASLSNNDDLLTEIQRRACRFFWIKADPVNGLINDRAANQNSDTYSVASIASTGYALAALVIAVERGWLDKSIAYKRALRTLDFLNTEMPNHHGWFYHFVDKQTGIRVWDSELSSIDTAILVMGALICGQYFSNTSVCDAANAIYNRLDWHWMLTNDGTQPDKLILSHGWKPESGFLISNWDSYCEMMFLYLLGLGAKQNPIPSASWNAWHRPVIEYGGRKTLLGGPIFVHQMSHAFYNFKDQVDFDGWNYWFSSFQATHINRQFCIDKSNVRATYSPNIWGINAGDYPGGYKAFSAPGDEDGTVSPSGAIASIIFTPDLSIEAARALFDQYGDRIWGDFGFSNTFNVDQSWYDTDVIGIDLGMVLLNIENFRTGLIWKLLESHPSTAKAWKAANFQKTYLPEILHR